tara:strand:- start:57 stop:269 length:213 start_codon:yes stop_codon:yes gene_type:complete
MGTFTITDYAQTFPYSSQPTRMVDHENGDTFQTQTISTYNIDLGNWRVGELTSQTTKTWLNGSRNSAQDR